MFWGNGSQIVVRGGQSVVILEAISITCFTLSAIKSGIFSTPLSSFKFAKENLIRSFVSSENNSSYSFKLLLFILSSAFTSTGKISFSNRFKKILRKHNLPTDLNVHSLRHSVASVLIGKGADVATVSSLLGHAQVSITLDIYTHAFDKNRKKAARVLHEGLGV